MSMHHDPELDDVLQDRELLHLADLLRSARRPEPPLDDAFRSELRRTLMQKAWEAGEGRTPWWSRLTTPPAFAWAGAAAGVLLIAAVVVYMSQQPGGQLVITSPVADAPAVQLQQPILVKFSQPMDHPSTEAAVQITPATHVDLTWQDNTLSVQPTNGDLAPNTQYQVTIGPSARTAAGQQLLAPQTITFVTEPVAPPPPPPPTPIAPPTPRELPGERQLAGPSSLGANAAPQWSADSSTIYFLGTNGALDSLALKGSDVKVLVADGVSSPRIAPAGDRLAYIRSGKIEVLTLAGGTTTELVVKPAPTTISWVKDKLFWSTADGVYTQGTDGLTQVAPLPPESSAVSIAPDGLHATFQQVHSLLLLDLATAKSTPLGPVDAQFFGWSPDGTRLIYSTADGNVVADNLGHAVSTILSGDASWSSLDEIVLGSDTELFAVRPDAFGLTKLANGTYHSPLWAPNGTNFTFVRGGALWIGSASPLPAEPAAIDLASSVVNSFMKARLAGLSDQAKAYLTDNGKQVYSSDGLSLLISGDPAFSRFYVLAQEITGTQPDSAKVVVRLVLTRGKLNVSDFDETLTLQRDMSNGQFLIDQAAAGARRDIGKGPEVVAIEVTQGTVKVTFDSDLKPDTVPFGVMLLDRKGKQVEGTTTYANKIATISGLDLVPGAHYRLVVLSTVHDWVDHNVVSEYDVDLVGPATANAVQTAPTAAPTPSPTRSPASSSPSP
jgi:Big-like domain-containing protein